jgi:hypothetical protein
MIYSLQFIVYGSLSTRLFTTYGIIYNFEKWSWVGWTVGRLDGLDGWTVGWLGWIGLVWMSVYMSVRMVFLTWAGENLRANVLLVGCRL